MLELSPVYHAKKGTNHTITVTFYDGDDSATVTGDVTVTVTREDGTELVSDATAQLDSGTTYQYTLSPTETVDLDELDVAFKGTVGGVEQTEHVTVSVVGEHLFRLSEARSFWPDKNKLSTDRATENALRSIRDRLAEDFEACCKRSFIPRYKRRVVSGDGSSSIVLPEYRVSSVRSIEVRDATTGDWEAYTASELDKTRLNASTLTDTDQTFPEGVSNVRIGYEYGYDRPPRPVRYAALILASYQANPPNTDPRATFMADELGQWRIALPDASRWGRWYGYPEVDSILARFASQDVTIW